MVAALLFCTAVSLPAAETNFTVAQELQVADQFFLAIPKAGFGKDYLFSASLIPQGQSPTSHGLAGKIVSFELFPDGVDMYESTKGLVVTDGFAGAAAAGEFSHRAPGGLAAVVVDFNKGMRRVFTQSWTDGGALNFESHDDVLEVPDSRVFEMRADGGQLIIRQSVQARSREHERGRGGALRGAVFHHAVSAGQFRGQGAEHRGRALHEIFRDGRPARTRHGPRVVAD